MVIPVTGVENPRDVMEAGSSIEEGIVGGWTGQLTVREFQTCICGEYLQQKKKRAHLRAEWRGTEEEDSFRWSPRPSKQPLECT